jgi:6-phosphogluconolactonase
MSLPRMTEHADAGALASAVAERLAQGVREGVAKRGSAWLALAGGSTPFAAYRLLAAMDLPWSAVHLIATDERWVDQTHAARNESALRQAFSAAAGVTVHALVPEHANEPAHTGSAEASLNALGLRPFDAVLLGMGMDAHIASLFPHVTPASAFDAGSRVSAITLTPDPLPPEAPFARVTLTLPRLLSTHWLGLMISGAGKRTVLENATERSTLEAPVNALLRAAPDLAIHWSP